MDRRFMIVVLKMMSLLVYLSINISMASDQAIEIIGECDDFIAELETK